MHNIKLFCGSIAILMLFSFSKVENKKADSHLKPSEVYEIPTDAKSILKRSCFECHHSDSKKILAKGKLSFDKLDELKDVKKIASLKKIEKEIKEDKMPPKKYTKNFPEKQLSEDEKKIVFEWINSELTSE
ncbi:heme-binding domain-containing protein [Plebeiibacterium sediminum]|uniref:Heme-binding domain-containing protein n=1 Tax=Plebeiibacterium sediminum TaxID=2992112 RepID=A0AAE3M1A2_9BACT|nr:heme-binding domain-containing protein [Plebeiobacterium sediminum]MCW3785377.1 heme-binding domain-containing protein [Plebeiobacterium sediminum]